MIATERARRMRERLQVGDVVTQKGAWFPHGVVTALHPQRVAVVSWPDGSWWRYPINELRKVC
jgi:hypothetical protein